MRPKSLLLLALALGCGLVASIGISQVMEKRGEGGQAVQETEPIFVAVTDIKEFDSFTDKNVAMEQWPKAKIPVGAFTKHEEWEGQRPKVMIFKGEPIIKAKIADKNAQPTAGIPQGMRTVGIPVDAVTNPGGLIKPHDKVDVLVYFARNPQNGINETTVRTILRKIEVFSVDNQYRRTDSGEEVAAAKTVTLLVTPDQAQEVTLASETGKIRLILRNGDDETKVDSAGESRFTDLGKGDSAQPTPPPEPVKTEPIKTEPLAQKPVEPAVTEATIDKKDNTFTMIIMEGKEMREVEFNLTSGGLPTVRNVDSKGTSAGLPAPIVSPEGTK